MISPGGLNNKATFGAVRGFGGDNPDILQNPANPNNLCKGLPKGRVVPISLGANGASYSVGLSISAHHPGHSSTEIIDPASNKIVEIGAGDNCATNPANQFDWTFTLKKMDQEFYQTCSDITYYSSLSKAGGGSGSAPAPPQPQPNSPKSPAPQPNPVPTTTRTKTRSQRTAQPQTSPQPQPPAPGGAGHTLADCKFAGEFLAVGSGLQTAPLEGDDAVCNNGRIDFKSNCAV
ncbi:hypothetical protein HDU81_009493 [Chytriomyces hyalinus]|nr:hypothetical protein HDU81_009493 [Chytriomyces hyalinus]